MQGFFQIYITIAVLFLVFLLLRAIMLWYWKVNKILETLEAILVELKKASGKQITK